MTTIKIIVVLLALYSVVSISKNLWSWVMKYETEAKIIEFHALNYLKTLRDEGNSKVVSAKQHFEDFIKYVKGKI